MGMARGYYTTRGGSPVPAVRKQSDSDHKRKPTPTVAISDPSSEDEQHSSSDTSDCPEPNRSESDRKRKRTPLAAGDPSSEVDQPSLSDIRVLHCPICSISLSIPVYQCPSGHLFCSKCHNNRRNISCHTCSKKLGNLRNYAMEAVLKSLKVSCSYKINGCPEKIGYCDKLLHEEDCAYAPMECPFDDCFYTGFPRALYTHLENQHTSHVIHLSLDELCQFPWVKPNEYIVFLEKGYDDNGAIFILQMGIGCMEISCIKEGMNSKGYEYDYSLQAFLKDGPVTGSLRVDSVTDQCNGSFGKDERLKDFLQALEYFLRHEHPDLGLIIESYKDKSDAEDVGQDNEFVDNTAAVGVDQLNESAANTAAEGVDQGNESVVRTRRGIKSEPVQAS